MSGESLKVGIPILITHTLRTMEEQQKLYDQGRVTPGQIVTKAKPGDSYHNYGLAFDFVVLRDKIPSWYERLDVNGNSLWDYLEVGNIGKALGLAWGGDWGWDAGHFEWRVLSIKELKAGKRPSETG